VPFLFYGFNKHLLSSIELIAEAQQVFLLFQVLVAASLETSQKDNTKIATTTIFIMVFN
jgi:hypothetical protein